MSFETNLFSVDDVKTEEVRSVLEEVYDALEERGYNATNQIVGYLISGDPGYISSFKDSRSKIQRLDRTGIVEVLFKNFKDSKWDI